MRRRLLAAAGIFVAVFGATFIATSATGSAVTVAVLATVVVAFLWAVAQDVRRKPWASESQRGQDVAYTAAAIAALHATGQAGSDCPSGFDGGFSGDCGAGGV
jgi:hypothetical protein